MSKPPQKWSDLKKKLKVLGVRGSITHMWRRAISYTPGGKSFRLFLIVLSEPRPTPQAIAAASQHTFRFATLSDIEHFQKDPNSKLFERHTAWIADGNQCLLQLDGEKLVGYTWVSTSQLIDLGWGFHVNLPDDMAYNYNGYTMPAYRGTAYQALRHLKVLEHVNESGKKRLFGYVDHLNFKSIKGQAKSGYVRVGVLHAIKRNGKTRFSLVVDDNNWSLATRAGPRHHVLE